MKSPKKIKPKVTYDKDGRLITDQKIEGEKRAIKANGFGDVYNVRAIDQRTLTDKFLETAKGIYGYTAKTVSEAVDLFLQDDDPDSLENLLAELSKQLQPTASQKNEGHLIRITEGVIDILYDEALKNPEDATEVSIRSIKRSEEHTSELQSH